MPSSGIGGPCDHCGRSQSCCWRRGPASKPCLCNACGSRYLVKKNLDGYLPIGQRASGGGGAGVVKETASKQSTGRNKSKASQLSATLTVALKPKRGATKRLDSNTWYQENFDSEESEAVAYLTDDSDDVPSITGQADVEMRMTLAEPVILQPHQHRRHSLLSEPSKEVLHISSTAQLKGLSSKDLARFFAHPTSSSSSSTMRLKPRKPMHPRISVVF